jgi:gliding motility-associated-like protein
LPTESDIHADYCEGYKYGYNAAGIYVDTLTSFYGCDSIRTLYLEASAFYIPNVFSPNDDGLNDVFEIISTSSDGPGLEYFAIFDRYGNMAYETNRWPVHWSGKGKGGLFYNPGVYTYVLKHNCEGENQVITGDITLIR